MSLPAGWVPVPLNPDGGLPQAAALPDPDGDLRLVLAAVAADLAGTLGARPDQIVWTSADQLARRPGSGPDPSRPQDVRDVASATALAALSAAPGQTLSADEVRVVVLVLAGQRVLAAQPALPARALAVADGDRLRGHLWVDDVTVTAGSLVGAGPTGTRLSLGWRSLSGSTGSTGTQPVGVLDEAEDPSVFLV